jgi:hypothetical protein
MPYSYITIDVSGDKKQIFSAECVIEKDVKVNIMQFRTLCSIEFQDHCSRNLNLPRSEYSVFGIYGQ